MFSSIHPPIHRSLYPMKGGIIHTSPSVSLSSLVLFTMSSINIVFIELIIFIFSLLKYKYFTYSGSEGHGIISLFDTVFVLYILKDLCLCMEHYCFLPYYCL